MRLYIEIFDFSGDQAHGAIVIADKNLDPITTIPISMPLQSYETAVENSLLTEQGLYLGAESTIFLSPNEITR